MQIQLNDSVFEIKVASISTLLDVVSQIETRIPRGYVITEISLNDRTLESNWFYNANKIYLLDEDRLSVKAEEPTRFTNEVLINSKKQYLVILEDFERIANSFRTEDEKLANQYFIQGIDNLQWYFKILEDAALLINKPLTSMVDDNRSFKEIISEIEKKLEDIIILQERQDWIMLADSIEYELVPGLRKIFKVYELFELD
ncbi:MAG: hypothetical protein RBS16_03455 [Candidatus Cloacimonadales bacterium]|jgi:hypothetical protein|nr:hypothetical protein [Candidatus Cloacimonadota bacterium]MDD2650423.1 hypothetical protein [Candidatus Cloacimonadota bacterium]MDD3502069.1 hypothetical protein [Candidatus Cloacimonadota bacterium]MDX9977071.1 hypothetical protein [Candidatus Cloacimonadales bacterium]